MKKRIYLFTIAAVAILIAVAVGFCIWKNSNVAEVDAPSVPTLSEEVITEPSSVNTQTSEETITPTETVSVEESNQQTCSFERYQEPLLDYPTEIWDTTGENWVELPYNTADAISLDMYYKGFTEIDFCNAVKPDPYNNLGACEMRNVVYTTDGTHYQIEFTHVTNVGTQREVSLNYVFRAEHTDELVDISGVGNPDAESICEPMDSLAGTILYSYGMKCEEGDSELIDVSLFYSPSRGNMYSLKKETTFEMLNKIIAYNDGQSYDPGFLSPYNPQGPNAIVFPLNNPSTYEFTVKYPDTEESKTYTFKIGSTFKEWASSRYNTDGWRADPKDKTKIISADSKYSLPANVKIQNKITARANT